MHNVGPTHDPQPVDTRWLADALHDLAQPLTALQCRLFLATMPRVGAERVEPQELQSALEDALLQCERVMSAVRNMQQKVT